MKEFKDLKELMDSLSKISIYSQIVTLLGAFTVLILFALNPLESFAKLPIVVQVLMLVILLAVLIFVGIDPSTEVTIRDLLLTLKKLISI